MRISDGSSDVCASDLLVSPLDHHAAVRRADVRCLQRQEVPAGPGDREHGGPQVRRVRADAHLLRPRGGQEGQEELVDGQAATSRSAVHWGSAPEPRRASWTARVCPFVYLSVVAYYC